MASREREPSSTPSPPGGRLGDVGEAPLVAPAVVGAGPGRLHLAGPRDGLSGRGGGAQRGRGHVEGGGVRRRRRGGKAGPELGLDLLDVAAGLPVGGDSPVAKHGIRAGVVGGDGEGHVAAELVEQDAEVLGPAEDVLPGVEGVGHAELAGGGGHELHEAPRALGRDGPLVELGLDRHDRSHQVGGDLVERGRFLHVVVVHRPVGTAALEAAGVDERSLAGVGQVEPGRVRHVRGLDDPVGVAPRVHLRMHRAGARQASHERQHELGRSRPDESPPRPSHGAPPPPPHGGARPPCGASRSRPRPRRRPPGRNRGGRRRAGRAAS